MQISKIKILSGNTLKILAALFMMIDHIGVLLLPNLIILRVIGRLSYPIFAFMISEGARYTKNKLKYFSTIFALATICQIVFYIFSNGNLYMCILVTFSISILLIYAMNAAKRAWFDEGSKPINRILLTVLFFASLVLTYFLNQWVSIDYGFIGCIAPVFASLFDFREIKAPKNLKLLDNLTIRVLTFAIPMLIMAIESRPLQYFGLISIVILLMYSEKRGKYNLKYFFYLFYPMHLVFLEGIYILISITSR